ncbi:hypothetical protein L6452_06568 [Arctium lappa]|uniref:Uncharacterized protein n=1 Tax=Arctium lappa TaxID=4217 RepID=A0ACB9EJS2_ARCLA|nr:hypothetical protein L6452_06568 [Arctium lappa]
MRNYYPLSLSPELESSTLFLCYHRLFFDGGSWQFLAGDSFGCCGRKGLHRMVVSLNRRRIRWRRGDGGGSGADKETTVKDEEKMRSNTMKDEEEIDNPRNRTKTHGSHVQN